MVAVENAAWVAGDDGWISDESSFYGDDETRDHLEDLLSRSPPPRESPFWDIQSSLPFVIAWKAQHQLPSKHKPGSTVNGPSTPTGKGKSRLYVSHDGDLNHRQSDETAVEFVTRLPPSITCVEDVGTWLWVDNPHFDRSTRKFDKDMLVERGTELLDDFRELEAETRSEMEGKAESTIGRKLGPKRRALEEALKKVAKSVGCVSGKWMLFPAVEDLDRVWTTVCEAVIAGRLGTGAKVATSGSERDQTIRIICLYTKDFSDVVDVRRVLDAMVELELIGEDDGGNGIYYKCDAYTYWGLESGNEFKLKASMYGSREMLRASKSEASGAKRKR